MIIKRSIQVKAAFLLVVFAMNTVVGFACSMGVDMGFNTSHHGQEAKSSVHIHKDGKKHVHKAAGQKHHHDGKTAASKKDDCCKGKVVKLQNADKNLSYTQTIIQPPVFIVSVFYRLASFNTVQGCTQEYIACHFHPPPRDILIAIQRFQI